MKITIEYCVVWNYEPKASGLGAAIQAEFPNAEVDLFPGGKGDFIVKANGNSIWDKRNMDDGFPEHEVILDKLRSF